MCDPVSATIAVASAVAAGASIYAGNKQAKAQKEAAAQAATSQKEAMAQQEREYNAENKRNPNVAQLMQDNTNAAKTGVGSTMLTGSGGIGQNTLNLSQSTLLGN